MTIMFRKDKSPIIGDKLKIDEHYMLDIDALRDYQLSRGKDIELNLNESSIIY